MASKLISVIAILALCGCKTVTLSQPQPVYVPVATSCASEADIPAEPKWLVPGAKDKDYAEKTKAILLDLQSAHSYIRTLRAAIDVN